MNTTIVESVVCWFGSNIDGITAISGFLAVIASIINLYVGYCVVKETRLLREEENRPDIVLSLFEDSKSPSAKNLHIRNLGRRVAKNIKFLVIDDREYFTHKSLSNLPLFKNGLSNLAPNEEISFVIAILTPSNFDKQTEYPFTIEVYYEDVSGKFWRNTFSFDFHMYENLGRIRKDP